MTTDSTTLSQKTAKTYHTDYDFATLERATETLRAIAHPQRIQIIEMLHQVGEVNVTEIHTQLGIEQAVVSHHLRILKDKDVVEVRRDGKNSMYRLANQAYFQLISLVISK
jgi:DNA-binding transcriptional ArsR family regulator